MSDARRESPWRRVREWTFALCTLWLVVQNTLLLVMLLTHRSDAVGRALAALPHAFALVTPLWMIPCAGMCGLVLATALARGAAPSHEAGRWEVEHGRAR
ncbi:MAG: hypothetical protein U0704_04970 [Candidatus Eisenbacteria bacterium]